MGNIRIMNSSSNTFQAAALEVPRLRLVNGDGDFPVEFLSSKTAVEWQQAGLFRQVINASVVLEDDYIVAVEREGEQVRLLHPIDIQKPILEVISALQNEIPATLSQRFEEAWAAKTPLADLASQFAQCTVILVQQVRFTALVEEALRSGNLAAVSDTTHDIITALQDVLRGGGVPKVQQQALAALLTLVLGQLNIGKQLLEASRHEAFDALWLRWHSYTRHYYTASHLAEKDSNASFKDLQQQRAVVTVRCVDREVPHGFQYIRRSLLVQTNLTHEAYRISMKALEQGAVMLRGPAGTGKSETQKDFAEWVLGYHAHVLNCSDSLPYKALCDAIQSLPHVYFILDEFNLCTSDAIDALLQASAASTRHMSVAMTFNPAAAAGAAIPDAPSIPQMEMVVPDVALIAEVMLAVEGLREFSSLAHHATALMDWCKASLSHQPHYDFGMRALKNVTRITGSLYRADPQGDEMAILARALWSFTARMTSADVALVQDHMQANFGEATPTAAGFLAEQPPSLLRAVWCASEDAARRIKLTQFVASTETRHGVAILTNEPRQVVQDVSTIAPLLGVQLLS